MTPLDIAVLRAERAYDRALDRLVRARPATPAWWAAEETATRLGRELDDARARQARARAEASGGRWLESVGTSEGRSA